MCGWVTSVIVNSPFRGNEIDESEARVLQKRAELRRGTATRRFEDVATDKQSMDDVAFSP